MLRLTNENLDTLRTAAAPLDPRDRGRYLEAVAEALRDHPNLDGGEFHRVCRAIAAQFRPARTDADPADAIDGALTHHKSASVIDVRFTPDATKLLRSSEMTRCARRRHSMGLPAHWDTLTAMRHFG
jgi:hypothetical protein